MTEAWWRGDSPILGGAGGLLVVRTADSARAQVGERRRQVKVPGIGTHHRPDLRQHARDSIASLQIDCLSNALPDTTKVVLKLMQRFCLLSQVIVALIVLLLHTTSAPV